ncbi:MAG: hypothetical protein KDC98_08870, partial [Planctomycetes bacterium]|nr:hypothetical protein [Planctomycetota bacterium]
MLPQPDDYTCGPTCLHAVYRLYGNQIPLRELIDGIGKTPSGGTADVYLANDALRRGYRAAIYTYNLRLFDPTWFEGENAIDIADRLRAQAEYKGAERPVLAQLTEEYLDFLALGGELRFADLTAGLLRRFLKRGVPILTGLSSTYLYRHVREIDNDGDDVDDDVRGEPQGHFVVLCGYRPGSRTVLVADPYEENPMASTHQSNHHYEVAIERAIGAIMLGVLT